MQSVGAVPAVSETTKQGTDIGGRWDWVEASVWTERMLAALENGVKGGKWFSLIDKVWSSATLKAAWEQVAANRGAAGVDRVSIERFRAHWERNLAEVSEALRAGQYRPLAVRRVEIPKGDGGMRPLGIPAVKDRVVQTALKMVLEPIFEREFEATSYGFRPGRGCKEALREVDRLLKAGYTYVVDADIQSYFDHIEHARLLARVAERISDSRVLALLGTYLTQEIWTEFRRWVPLQGTPQGAVISPVLANIYLHPLDVALREGGYSMVRYADDFVILCESRERAHEALAAVRAWMEQNGLSLHPEKTQVGDCRVAGQGFEFLGYRFEAGRRWVRKKSLKALREKIRTRTRRTRGDSILRIIAELNPMLRGWFGYFKHAPRGTFLAMDGFVRRRLRAVLRKHEKRPGFGRCHADNQRWPNAYFAQRGLFTLYEAHIAASRSR